VSRRLAVRAHWGMVVRCPDEAGNHFFAIELVYRDSGGTTGEPALTGRDGVAVGIE